ncbi:hypothetical protein L1987_74586 [Smallanthus sonchifolius]|uniref:Uncharacterized protein n=1 Tax=Smallanthus sonchifolius TaxID=185202 RepID=A0ACB9A3C5_9ASTR|nr:hypothetical protein L1987_74586 [Smallanthus sonchifolius]
MAVVIGTALEMGFNELLKVVVSQTIQTAKMKTLLKRLEKTLKVIEPMFGESCELSKALDRPANESAMFIVHLKKGKELVLRCSRIKFWNVYQKWLYSNKLIRLNNELLSFFQVDLQALMMNAGMRSLKGVHDLADKMDQVLSAVTTTHHVRANYQGCCGVPGFPEHIVGFSWHLQELRRRLLNHDTGVLVVSGPGGCGRIPINVTDDLVNKIVKFCKGLPLALTVVGASLCGQPVLKWKTTLKKWSQGGSILQSNSSMLLSLKTSVDALDDEFPAVKECFLDLGSFPEDERISASLLMDMWVELYNLDDEDTSETLLELYLRNLINLVPLRKDAGELDDGYYEAFCSIWYDLKAPKAEVLTLNIRSKRYALPEFIERMSQLKVLSIRSYSDYPSQLHNLSLFGCLSNLRTIRFEHVSVSSIQHIFELRNLRKLSFAMCEIGNALMSCTTDQSPPSNLTDLEIDMCYDLKEVPSGLCNLVHLQKLSITNCQELDVLPKWFGSLSNLETLRLHCCTKLQELPKSIGNLRNLSFIDISDCLSISVLPEEIGELCGLKVLKMDGCNGLQELPVSMCKLLQLEDVICDEEISYLWWNFESDLPNLKIKLLEDDKLESFMKIVK